jgi:uncharacterized protein (TIGR02996 family)
MSLKDVEKLIAGGHQAKALDAMIVAWKGRKLSRLGDAIDALDAQLPKPTVAPGDQRGFFKGLKTAKSAELGAFYTVVCGGQIGGAGSRITAAQKKGNGDPRLAAALLGIVRDVPWTSSGSRGAWRVVFDTLDGLDDPRVLERGDAARANWKFREDQRQFLDAQLRPLLESYKERWPGGVPKPTADEDKLLAKIEKAIGSSAAPSGKKGQPQGEEALLAAIYDAPDDDGPRLVYADYLTEKGDPRGEFIALQIRGGDPKREKELIKKHGAGWLGPLAPVLLKEGIEFRRGFVAAARARFGDERRARQYGTLPAWATVEKLSHGVPGAIPRGQEAFLWWIHPAMTSLRDVGIAGAPLDALLGAEKPWKIERLGISVEDPDRLRAIADSDRLPKLVALRADGIQPGWLGKTSLAGRIKDLWVYSENGLDEFLPELAALPKLERFGCGDWTLTRDARGDFTVATCDQFSDWAYDAIPADALTSITVTKAWVRRDEDPIAIITGLVKNQRYLEKLDLTKIGGKVTTFKPKSARPSSGKKTTAVATAAEDRTLRAPSDLAWPVAGRLILRDHARVIVVDPAAKKWRVATEVLGATRLAASPDGGLAALATLKSIRIIDLDRGREEAKLEGHTDDVDSLLFFPDGKRLLSGSSDRTLRVWELAGKKLVATKNTASVPESPVLLGGDRVLANGPRSRPVIVDVLGSARSVRFGDGERWMRHFVAAADGRVAAANGSTLVVFSAAGVQLVAIEREIQPDWLAFLGAAGDRIALRDEEAVAVYKATGGKPIVSITAAGATGACASPDGARLAIAFPERIEIWAAAPSRKPLAVVT